MDFCISLCKSKGCTEAGVLLTGLMLKLSASMHYTLLSNKRLKKQNRWSWTNTKTMLKRKHGVCLSVVRLHLTHESVQKNVYWTPDYLWMQSYEPVMSTPSMKFGCSGLLGNRYQQLCSLAAYDGSMVCPWEVFKLTLASLRNIDDLLLLMQSAWDVSMCGHLK